MHILIAPNAFKNSLDATAVAEAIAQGFSQSRLNCTCQVFPVGDGGDGTGSLLVSHFKGERISVNVHDALGRSVNAEFGLIDNGKTAVIEMADAVGMRLLKTEELDPLVANTTGTGEMIRQALDHGARKIIIGMGGSATVDGGTGILSALGIRFLNGQGQPVNLPAELSELSTIDTSCLDKRISECDITILCDVENKLLGDQGAAAVFGPQKGASESDVVKLDAALSKFAAVTLTQTGKDITAITHGGTAGGAAAGLYAFLNARLVSGATHFLELTGFDAALQNADLVITGEGSIDEQTLQGKAPFAVAYAAKQKHIKVIGIAGKVPLTVSAQLEKYFDALFAISNEPVALNEAMANTRENLIRTAKQIGNLLAD